MTMRTMLVFIALAAVLVALVALDVTDVGTKAACDEADAAAASGLLAQADKGYNKILADDPKRPCALTGKRAVASKMCAQARQAARGKAGDEARKAFATLLVREPPDERACAIKGLRDPPPKPPADGAKLTVVIKGAKGDRGRRGEKGETGDTTRTISRLSKIIIYCDVRTRRACRMAG
jgi:hypothetical protein